MSENKFTFEISLSVLNHLGRNLYRSFATILGEAISNSWDADSQNVWIDIDRKNSKFTIMDDGIGMTADDLQNKFLKIGYSKRKDGSSKSVSGRPFIGRKGIGKLALLSCAQKISVLSKTNSSEYVGVVIDNSQLDEAIDDEWLPQQLELESVSVEKVTILAESHEHGTIIEFDGIRGGIWNQADYLKQMVARYFRFSVIDKSFTIYVNDSQITIDELSELAKRTEFLWNITAVPLFREECLVSN